MKRAMFSVVLPSLALLAIAAVAFAYTTEQAQNGKELYADHCAVCHGPDARGGVIPDKFERFAGRKAPPIAGPGALTDMKNAAQVYEYAEKRMPLHDPGSLEEGQYLDIVAFALQANGIPPNDQPLTPESAKKIKLSGNK